MKTDAPIPKGSLIQFKGSSLKIIQVQLREADPARLGEALAALTGGATDFFDGELAVLDLAGLPLAAEAGFDLAPILDLLRRYGLQPAAVLGAAPGVGEAAAALGLAILAADALGRPRQPAVSPPPVAAATTAAPVAASPEGAQTELPLDQATPAVPPPAAADEAVAASPPATVEGSPTLIIDKPLRSGQRVYARGGDLVVLAMVSAGAEVIADGNIHVYAPLRGRALAGAAGDASARIFTTSLEAELVSIAGIYRTFEGGLPAALEGQPARIGLAADAASLAIEPLAIR